MEQDLRHVGEKALLQRIRSYLRKSKTMVRTFSEDCAAIAAPGNKYQLFTVDVLIEGVHFRRDFVPAFYIGRKGLKVSLSDVSAMGGRPLYFLVSIGAPPETAVRMIDEIYEGMDSVAKEEKISLIGGNLSTSPVLFLDVILIGEVMRNSVLMRDGARKGDLIFVTGQLGSAAEGLKLLQDGFRLLGEDPQSLILPAHQRDSDYVREAILAQIDPPCLNSIARRLASWKLLNAMIDLSDGLASDLPEICRESQVGAIIDLARVPVAPAAHYWETKRNLDPLALALQGGEDYHLLFTVSARKKTTLLRRAAKEKVPLFEIGKIVERSEGIFAIDESGKKMRLENGHQHFR